MYAILKIMQNDFKTALEYIEKTFSESEFQDIMSGGNDIKKAAAVLNLEKIENQNTADMLINHLTNQSGPLREACAFKLSELLPDYKEYFLDKKTLDTITASLNDVNPNVVRFMLKTLKYIDNKEYIFEKLLDRIIDLHREISDKPKRGKVEEHIFTKKCFKIYWALESIKFLISEKSDIIKFDTVLKGKFEKELETLYCIEEYTIREKVAQISGMLNEEYSEIKMQVKEDKNYFVRRCGKDFNENIGCR